MGEQGERSEDCLRCGELWEELARDLEAEAIKWWRLATIAVCGITLGIVAATIAAAL